MPRTGGALRWLNYDSRKCKMDPGLVGASLRDPTVKQQLNETGAVCVMLADSSGDSWLLSVA